jgi:hypothetical protein
MKIFISERQWKKKGVRLHKNIAIAKAKKQKKFVSRAKGLAARSQRP